MTAHKIELDSVVVWSNKYEFRRVNRAKFGDLDSVGDGENIRKIATMMQEAGYTGPCEVYRGDMLVFSKANVEDWASGRALKTKEQPEWLKKK